MRDTVFERTRFSIDGSLYCVPMVHVFWLRHTFLFKENIMGSYQKIDVRIKTHALSENTESTMQVWRACVLISALCFYSVETLIVVRSWNLERM